MGESDVAITYTKLYEIVRTEKDRDQLQKLPKNFYNDFYDYLRTKHEAFDKTKYKTDLFAATERDKLSMQIRNIHKLIKELYDKRESKIVSMSMHKARTRAHMMNTEALETREFAVFDAMCQALESGREVGLGFLQQHAPPVQDPVPFSGSSSQSSSESDNSSLSSPSNSITDSTSNSSSELSTPSSSSQPQEKPSIESKTPEPSPASTDTAVSKSSSNSNEDKTDDVELTKVRFIKPVPQFMGKQLETYGPYEAAQESDLPVDVARILISRGRAVEIE